MSKSAKFKIGLTIRNRKFGKFNQKQIKKMKNFLFATVCFFIATVASAQSNSSCCENAKSNIETCGGFSYPAKALSYQTNDFWSNWYVQGGINWSVFYSDEEDELFLNKSMFKSFRATPGISVALGKWITPSFSLRTKLYGLWAKRVTCESQHTFKYVDMQEQLMFNFSNLLFGYNSSRIWNMNAFIGAGVAYSAEWDRLCMSYSTGIHSSWKLNDKFNIYGEAGLIIREQDFDNSPKVDRMRTWYSHDRQLYFEAGVTYNLGKSTWCKSPDIEELYAIHQAELDAINAQLNKEKANSERLAKLLKDCENRPAQFEKELVALPVSVFFDINKTTVRSNRDLVNLKELADFAIANNSKICVTGFADSATGTSTINKKLSIKRANEVKKLLVEMGVPADRINVDSKGGVADIKPDEYNRRAISIICE